MKLRITLDINELERKALQQLIGKETNIQFEEYRKAISDLVKNKLNESITSDRYI